jgi:hypothetical protein
VLDTLQSAKQQLPPHDQWLSQVLGMPRYRKSG